MSPKRIGIINTGVILLSLLTPHCLFAKYDYSKPPKYYAEIDSYWVSPQLTYIAVFAHARNDVVFAKGGWFGWKYTENGVERVDWKFRADCGSLQDIYFKNAREGWLWSDCGQIYQTKDSGITWEKISETKYIAGRYMELYALTDEIIFLSNRKNNYNMKVINILLSRDHGQTWRALPREEILGYYGLTPDEYQRFEWPLGKEIQRHLAKTPGQPVARMTGLPADPTNQIPGSFDWDPDEWRRKHPGLPDPPPDKRNLAPDQYPGPGTPSPKAVPEVPPPAPAKSPEAANPAR